MRCSRRSSSPDPIWRCFQFRMCLGGGNASTSRRPSTDVTGPSDYRGLLTDSRASRRRLSGSPRCVRGRPNTAAYNFLKEMATLTPFRALRPNPADASRIASVPYDVVNTDEARVLADGNPLSFLRVSRAEIELPAGTDPHADAVYDRAVQNFAALRRSSLIVEDEASVYLYRLRMGTHEQTGVAACWALDEYDRDVIKKHERTRRDKEDDRTRHMIAIGAQTGPVFLTYRASAPVDEAVRRLSARQPLFDFQAPDDVQHTVWQVGGAERNAIVDAFRPIQSLYIADGHHRAASAAR